MQKTNIQLAGNYTFGIQKYNIVLDKLLDNLATRGEEIMIERGLREDNRKLAFYRLSLLLLMKLFYFLCYR